MPLTTTTTRRFAEYERLLARLIEARRNLETLSRLNREALGKELS